MGHGWGVSDNFSGGDQVPLPPFSSRAHGKTCPREEEEERAEMRGVDEQDDWS